MEQANEIRELVKYKILKRKEIAKLYKVNISVVNYIVNNRSYVE